MSEGGLRSSYERPALGNVFVDVPHAESGRIAAWAKHQFALEAFRQVLDLLGRERIPVLPVKGIVLAHTLYDGLEERPMFDVDLRVRPRDLHRLEAAARRAGWVVGSASRQLGTVEFCVSRTMVEVETTIGPPGVCAVAVEQMLERAVERVGSLGVPHLEPDIHDHALLLCVNAFKDKLVLSHPWAREDLLRIARCEGFASEALTERAAAARLSTLVGIVAEWLSADPRGEPWRRVSERNGRVPRPRYAAVYRALVRTVPDSALTALVARAASDAPLSQATALALGFVGTMRAAARRSRL